LYYHNKTWFAQTATVSDSKLFIGTFMLAHDHSATKQAIFLCHDP